MLFFKKIKIEKNFNKLLKMKPGENLRSIKIFLSMDSEFKEQLMQNNAMELKFSIFKRPKLYDFYEFYKSNFLTCIIKIFKKVGFRKVDVEIDKSMFKDDKSFEDFLIKNQNLKIHSVFTAFGGAYIECVY